MVDFVSSVLKLNLRQIADQKIKILSNGGVNPEDVLKMKLIKELKLDLKVAVVLGDEQFQKMDFQIKN